MNPILFEQIRDKVKEAGVADMINDRLIELQFSEHKRKMSASLDEIRTRQRIIYARYVYNFSVHFEIFSWDKNKMHFYWCNDMYSSVRLRGHRLNMERVVELEWESPPDISKFKSDNILKLIK